MTKKFLSLVTVLMLLLSAASALADAEKYRFKEAFDAFDFEMELPEGAQYRQNLQGGLLCFEIWFVDASKPAFDMHVSFSEEMAGQNLGDTTDDEKSHLAAMVAADFSDPGQLFFVTEAGNTVLFSRETDPEAGDYATMVSVYKGFFFSLYCSHDDFSPLSDEDFELMHQIMEGAWIIDTQA